MKFLNSIRITNSVFALLTLPALIHLLLPEKEFTTIIFDDSFQLLVLSIFLALVGGYSLNNLLDFKTDEINDKNKNILAFKPLKYIAIIGHSSSLVVSIFLTSDLFLNLIYFNGLLLLYNLYFKRKVLIGNILIAGISFFPFILSFTFSLQHGITSNETNLLFFLLFGAVTFLAMFAREIIKDIEDIEGDQQAGYQSLPIIFSIQTAKITSILSVLLSLIIFNYILLERIWFGLTFRLALLGFICISTPLILSINALINPKINNPKKAQILIKFAMFFGILFLYLLQL